MDVKDNVNTTAPSVTFLKEHFICSTYSQRNASFGFTEAARRAGT